MAPFVTRAAKGAWKGPIWVPLYLRDVHLWDVPRTAHLREQQEAHLRAPASLRLDPPCPHRARIDQKNRDWRTWKVLWDKEVPKLTCETSVRRDKSNQKRFASYEMRARTSSGLPGGYLEALCAGARLKNACCLAGGTPCETTSCMPVTGMFQEIPDNKVNSCTSERSRRPT